MVYLVVVGIAVVPVALVFIMTPSCGAQCAKCDGARRGHAASA